MITSHIRKPGGNCLLVILVILWVECRCGRGLGRGLKICMISICIFANLNVTLCTNLSCVVDLLLLLWFKQNSPSWKVITVILSWRNCDLWIPFWKSTSFPLSVALGCAPSGGQCQSSIARANIHTQVRTTLWWVPAALKNCSWSSVVALSSLRSRRLPFLWRVIDLMTGMMMMMMIGGVMMTTSERPHGEDGDATNQQCSNSVIPM